MTQQAKIALRAVEITRMCGRYAGRKFAVNNGVLGLWRLAMQLESAAV